MAPRSELQVPFGQVVAKLRVEAGISQEELAARAGLHRTYVSLVERGKKSPTLGAAARLAAGLHTSLSALVSAAEAENRAT